MSSEPDDEAIRTLHAMSARRQRNSRRLVLFGVLLAVLLLALSPLFVQFYRQAKGRAALQRELDAIVGEPLTTSELAAYYALPANETDATHVWQQALVPFGDEAYEFSTEGLPIVGGGRIPDLSIPLNANQQELIKRFLTQHAAKLEALHTAAQTPGQVRFPKDFRTESTLHEQRLARVATRLLALEFQSHVRQNRTVAALKNLETRVRLGETLAKEVDLSSWMIRGAIHGHTLHDIRAWANATSLEEATLVQLQGLAEQTSPHQQLVDALLGERVQSYIAACQPIPPVATLETTRDFRQVIRPADCARMLHYYSQLLRAAGLPLPDSREAMKVLSQEVETSSEREGFENNLLTREQLPAAVIVGIADTDARFESQCQLTVAALAAHRFRKTTGAWPTRCEDLAPQFMAGIPMDPYDGQPLRLRHKHDGIVIYSIGSDDKDDGGSDDSITSTVPDIAIEVKVPASE